MHDPFASLSLVRDVLLDVLAFEGHVGVVHEVSLRVMRDVLLDVLALACLHLAIWVCLLWWRADWPHLSLHAFALALAFAAQGADMNCRLEKRWRYGSLAGLLSLVLLLHSLLDPRLASELPRRPLLCVLSLLLLLLLLHSCHVLVVVAEVDRGPLLQRQPHSHVIRDVFGCWLEGEHDWFFGRVWHLLLDWNWIVDGHVPQPEEGSLMVHLPLSPQEFCSSLLGMVLLVFFPSLLLP